MAEGGGAVNLAAAVARLAPHPDTDDCFLVLDGRLTIQLRDRDVVLEAGELFVVPGGVEHQATKPTAGHHARLP